MSDAGAGGAGSASDAGVAGHAGGAGAKGGLVGYFARNHVAANALMLLLLGGGLFAARQVAVERFPEYDPRTVTVTVPYPGAAPAEVEQDVTRRVEESVAGVVGVERVLSTSGEGVGMVTLELRRLADAVDVLNAVRTAVERIEGFPPPDAEQPEIVRNEVARPILTLALSTTHLNEHDLRREAEVLREALLALPSVSLVSLSGARDREIQIELSEEALRRHGLTIDQVVSLMRRSSFNLSGGALRTAAGEVVIGTFTQRTRAEEFRDVVLIAGADGSVVRLGDVAVLRDGFVEEELISQIDGRPAVFVRVDAAVGQPTQEIAEQVQQFLTGYVPPPGADLALWQDENRLVVAQTSAVVGNAVIGAVLVLLTLLLIFDLRLALWIAAGIPISFLGSLALFGAAGMSINGLTLFGFFIVTGIVVDDAIVVGESIARQRELGQRGAAASIAGVRAVAGPVAVGALTTVIAFLALLPLEDAWGQLFRVVPVVVALVLAVSLLEAFCILPSHLAGPRLWSRSPLAEFQTRMRQALEHFVHGKLVRAIAAAVRFPHVTVLAVVLAVVAAAALVATGAVRYDSFPPSPGSDRLQAVVTMPVGTQFETTAAAAEHLARAARDADRDSGGGAVAAVSVLVGRHRPLPIYEGTVDAPSGSHLATVEVKFNRPPVRSVSVANFRSLWRRAAGVVRGAETVSFQISTQVSESTSVSYVLIHDDDEVLAQAVTDLRSAYAAIEAVHEVEDSQTPGRRRYDVQLTAAGVAAGLTPVAVADQLRDAFFGAEVQRVQRGRDEIKVMVRYPGERRRSLRDLLDERITTPAGRAAPLSTVARITEAQDPQSLLRIDGQRAVTVTAWFDPSVSGSRQINAQLQGEIWPALEARYPGLSIRRHGATRDAAALLRTLTWSFALALLVIYGLLASQLRSFAQPLLALAGMPMAIVGAVVGHFVLGYGLTNISLFGIIAVSGVVVNDTLILLDRYNTIRAADPDLPPVAAIAAAARHRSRAILLTTVTTVMGLLPMLYDKSEVIQYLAPMVISLGAGLVFASVGVLFLVPAVLIIVEMAWYSPLFAALRGGSSKQRS